MYFLRFLLLTILMAHAPLHVLTNSDETVEEASPSTTEGATKLVNINTLEDNCEDAVCSNFNYPNKSEIAFFDLKPQIRFIDDETYNIKSPFEVDALVFKNSIFAHFPLHFFYSVSVRELDMRNCSIETLTWENFLMAENLRILLLSQNKISAINEMTFNYASELQYLFLDSNRLHTLVSESFKGLSQLRYLDLSFNHLKDLPGTVFAYLPNINELNLANNRLNYLPNEIFSRNPALTSVILRNNRLRTLDEYLFRSQLNLIFVDISNNVQLSQLIMNIQTRYLVAGNCSLYLVNLYGQVTNVDLRDNEIVELYFAQPESIEKLVLRNNTLQQIASLARAINLRELDLADNPGLEYLPDPWSVNSLERLDLSNTSLRYMPISNLAEQSNLQVLNVSNNKLQDINPGNFKYLEKLKQFYIAANDWNCYNLRLIMDILIKPNRINYKKDIFDAEFPGEYIEGIACMYRIEDDRNAESDESTSSLNELLKGNKPYGEKLMHEASSSYESTNEYPADGSLSENELLKREIATLRKELKAIVTFYESKFDKVFAQLENLNKRIGNFEHINETMLKHITIMT